ncbi:hypothetical protein [Micromonospora avicenniae]|uniref:hypothetical protein n=1 Tax=Micromonospora avicenniae TaxID=1198245 RepID=UPI00331B11CE
MKTPEQIAKAAEAQGFRVKKVTHGWWIFPHDKNERAVWISRNTNGRGGKNNLADARRAGVVI